MRNRLLVILAVSMMVPASVLAQAGSEALPPTGQEVELKVNKAADLSDSEKVEKAREHLDRMRQGLSDVLKKLEEARDTKDVIKLNCVNEKLTQIKGMLKISETADISLEEAVARKEIDAADNEFTKIVIARQKVDQLRTETEECLGEIIVGLGDEETIVEVEEPDGLTEADPTAPHAPPTNVIRPPAASPVE